LARPGPLRPGLEEILEAVDREIGRLVEDAGPEAAVMVFSLHGMRPALGIPAFLGPLLCERGLSRLAQWSTQSGAERIASMIARLKRRAPAVIKRFYSGLPASARRRLARPTMMPVYDWTATRAVALPTDQHGWIRVNLAGREAAGIVPLDQYDATCDEIAAFVRSLRDEAGRPLVRSVVRTAEPADAVLEIPLPDLVVHWEERACAAPFAIQGSQVIGQTVSANLTSQHAFEGFCLWRGPSDPGGDGPLASTAMHRMLLDAMAPVRAQ
jgi:predicted AlkP superfamily phosphohydrolase/phosphomutase